MIKKFSTYRNYSKEEYQIFENLAQAKSVLRKSNVSESDEKFQKIINATNKDGWTGLMTKFVFIEGKDVDEVLSLYNDLKNSKLDLGKLNKLSYEEVIDEVYKSVDSKDGNYVGHVDNYKIYYVPSYEEGLNICSPSWCLKTRKYWNEYMLLRSGTQFVAIEETYIKNNKTTLLSPNSPQYFGGYSNETKAHVRYGITIYPSKRVFVFDDNNKNITKSNELLAAIISKIEEYVEEFNLTKKVLNTDEFDIVKRFFETGLDLTADLNEFNYNSFSMTYYEDFDKMIENFFKIVGEKTNTIFTYEDWLNFFKKNETLVMSDDFFVSHNGFMDVLLYKSSKGRHPLWGVLMKETDDFDLSYKYLYGYHNHKYGRLMVEQSYGNVTNFFEYLLENFATVFMRGESYGSLGYVFGDYIDGYDDDFKFFELYLEELIPIENGFQREFRYKIFTRENNQIYNAYKNWREAEENGTQEEFFRKAMKETGWSDENGEPNLTEYLGSQEVNPDLYDEVILFDKLTEMNDNYWLSNIKEIFEEEGMVEETENGLMITLIDSKKFI